MNECVLNQGDQPKQSIERVRVLQSLVVSKIFRSFNEKVTRKETIRAGMGALGLIYLIIMSTSLV
jgi:hypothetical protein